MEPTIDMHMMYNIMFHSLSAVLKVERAFVTYQKDLCFLHWKLQSIRHEAHCILI